MQNHLADWSWILTSPGGLLIRCGVGVAIFAALLAADMRRHGWRSPRLKEYGFLVIAVVIGAGYGALNDLLTSSISWEYFYYGKGLDSALGPVATLSRWRLRGEAMKIGLLAGGSGALIGAAILLLTNSVGMAGQRALAIKRLLPMLALVWLVTIAASIVIAAVGLAGGLAWTSADLAGIVRNDLFRPRRFLCVYGIHLGAYVGAVGGTILACARIIRQRKYAQSSA